MIDRAKWSYRAFKRNSARRAQAPVNHMHRIWKASFPSVLHCAVADVLLFVARLSFGLSVLLLWY